uniref:Signal recognition particle 19 kDa protein n=1 Tax=Propithecus coquereli TaxID=379532 RepID=A0A2K6FN05_PROCO
MACAAARSPADQDMFICIYPAYLNNKKTIAEGRRIPISKAVENPTATEIQDVCKSVMLYAAEMIPKLKTRTQKTGVGDQSLQQGEGSKKGKGKKKK